MQINIGYEPFEYQKEFHESPARFRIVAGGRRVGKSFSVLHDAIRHCLLIPDAMVWWVSPTYNEAREVGFEVFKNHEELLPLISSTNESRLTVKFINGSKLYFKSADNESSLRGRGLTHLVIDEAAFVKKESVWKKALRPALSDRKGTAVLISSPNGRNWFYEQFQRAKNEKLHLHRKTWDFFHWPTHINPTISEDEIEIAKSELSDIDFRQEYLAEFVTPAGMVYDNFSEDNVVSDFKLNMYHDIYLGADFGFANPSAICFMAYDRRDQTVTMFDEVYEERKSIQELTRLIHTKLQQYNITELKWIYTDPAGNAAELTSGTSPVDYLRMEGGFNVINKGTLIAPGIALVRSWVKAYNGKRRFFVADNCKEAIRSMYGYCYEFKKDRQIVDEEPLKDGIHDHMCDAIRYFFVNRFDKAKFVAHTLPQEDMFASPTSSVIMKKCSMCRRPFASKSRKNEPPFKCNKCEGINVN